MALALLAITVRSATRIRLSFDHVLASGAFAPGPYSVENLDAVGIDPPVKAALVVPNSPETVEVILAEELIGSGLYRVSCTAVPDTEPATFTGSLDFRPASAKKAPSATFAPNELDRALYGSDLVWDGADVVESATGDLETTEGVPNVENALTRQLLSDGLPWDETYGAKERAFVDAPSPSLPAARANAQRAILSDDRVRSVVSTVQGDDNGGAPIINLEVELVGGQGVSMQHDPNPAR